MFKHLFTIASFGFALCAGGCLYRMPLPLGLMACLSLGIVYGALQEVRDAEIVDAVKRKLEDAR